MDQSKSLFIIFLAVCCLSNSSMNLLFSQTLQRSQLVPDQQNETPPPLDLLEETEATQRTFVNKNQISLDVLLTHFLFYVRRVGNTNLSIGGGLGFAWELNSHSFERNIWEAGHIVVFGRYQFSQVLQVDIGPTLLNYYWTDDCSECSGTFLGLHTAVMIGYRSVFIGPCLRLGWADDRKYGSEFGTIWSFQARFVVSWGK
jgi:hypothetical protein